MGMQKVTATSLAPRSRNRAGRVASAAATCSDSHSRFALGPNRNCAASRDLYHGLLKPRVLGFGSLQNRDIGVCILPKSEESLVRSLRLGLIPRHSKHSAEL